MAQTATRPLFQAFPALQGRVPFFLKEGENLFFSSTDCLVGNHIKKVGHAHLLSPLAKPLGNFLL